MTGRPAGDGEAELSMILPGVREAIAAREQMLLTCARSVSAGDSGFFGPDSMTWRIVSSIAYGISAIAALLLEALHPVAMAAMERHSDYREDAWRRACRTADYVFTTTFGSTADATAAAARVRKIHQATEGEDPITGRRYRADDSDLLMWIHCTNTEMALRGHERYVGRLTQEGADLFVQEQVRSATLVGLPEACTPRKRMQICEAIAGVEPCLSKPAAEFVRLLLDARMPFAMRGLWALHVVGAIALLPSAARDLYSLPRWSVRGHVSQATIGLFVRLADRRFNALGLVTSAASMANPTGTSKDIIVTGRSNLRG